MDEMLGDEPNEAEPWVAQAVERIAREVARDEVAALAGLFLRRLQEVDADQQWYPVMKRIWGEALNDFGKEPTA